MYRRILVPLDGSTFAEAALPHALALARRWESDLELATVANVPLSGASDFPQEDALARTREYARKYLDGVGERLGHAGYTGALHQEVIPAGNVPRSLMKHVEARSADFAVMTTHGRGPLGRAWLGSSADGFMRRSSVPLLLIRPEEDGARPDLTVPPPPFRRILVPLDGSEEAESAMRKALPLAAEDAELILLRVVLDPSLPGDSPYLPHVIRDARKHQDVETAARSYLERISAEVAEGSAISTETRVLTAPRAAPAILEAASREHADLVALATAGRGGTARLFLGSVADKVIRSAPVPVLTYRAPDED